jgi:hypothetical protein
MKNIQTLLIIVLVAIIIFMRSCPKSSNLSPKTIVNTTIEYIPVIETIPEYIPQWREKLEIRVDTFQIPIDTTAILIDYYSKYFYKDTLKVDTLGYVIINDTITQNKILSRVVVNNFNIPKITIEKTTYINNREFYLGVGLQGTKEQLNYVGSELLFRTRNSQIYGIGIGMDNNFQPTLKGGIYWKLGK